MLAVLARCPKCDTLREIVPTGTRQLRGWTAEWWTIVAHKSPGAPELCPGSGAHV